MACYVGLIGFTDHISDVFDEQRDDFLSIHESIKKLRSYFGSDNPGCETIDQLEDEIVTLFNRLCLREPFAKKNQVISRICI